MGFGSPDQTHHADLFFGNKNGQANGVERNNNRNQNQKQSQKQAELLCAAYDRVQPVNHHLVLGISHLVNNRGGAETERAVGLQKIRDVAVFPHCFGFDL